MATAEPISTAESPPVTPLSRFIELCGEDEFIELVRGEIVQMAPAGGEHGQIGMEVAFLLGPFIRDRGLGILVNADTGFILEEDPPTVRSPDLAFISSARLEGGRAPKSFIQGGPDLAVEILSPTDSLAATEAKARMYLRAGSRVVWILHPAERTVRVYRPDSGPQAFGPEDEADAEPALPGFRVPVARLFGLPPDTA